MNSSSVLRLLASAAVLAGSAAVSAQTSDFVVVDSLPLAAANATGNQGKLSSAVVRTAPVVMETRAHVHADGSVSTSCASIPSSVPHAMRATREITKQQER